MAEMDDVLAELRHRIMGPIERPPKPVSEPVEAITPLPARGVLHPAMTQPGDLDRRHGSTAVAPRRLAHPGRDGGVVVGDDPISPLLRRLSIEMPELMGEVVAFIERRTAELNDDDAAPRPAESVVPAALLRPTPTLQDDDTGIASISLRFDTQMLARIDADAKRLGISRTAWLHVAAGDLLEAGDDPVVGKRDTGAARVGVAYR